jgi:hypothetical protein
VVSALAWDACGILLTQECDGFCWPVLVDKGLGGDDIGHTEFKWGLHRLIIVVGEVEVKMFGGFGPRSRTRTYNWEKSWWTHQGSNLELDLYERSTLTN